MLPGKDGFDVCRELRKAGIQTPILSSARWRLIQRNPTPSMRKRGAFKTISPTFRKVITIPIRNWRATTVACSAATTVKGLVRSLDRGNTWSPVVGTGLTAQISSLVFDSQEPNHLFAGTYGAGFSRSRSLLDAAYSRMAGSSPPESAAHWWKRRRSPPAMARPYTQARTLVEIPGIRRMRDLPTAKRHD